MWCRLWHRRSHQRLRHLLLDARLYETWLCWRCGRGWDRLAPGAWRETRHQPSWWFDGKRWE